MPRRSHRGWRASLDVVVVKLPWAPKIDSELAHNSKSVVHLTDIEPKRYV